MTEYQFTIKGMHCNSCKMLVEEELEDAGAKNIMVTVDTAKSTGTASLESDLGREEIIALIEDLGDYSVQ